MADLVKAVSKTVHPDGKVQIYEHGMLLKIKKTTSHEIDVWHRWLKILKVKYKWV